MGVAVEAATMAGVVFAFHYNYIFCLPLSLTLSHARSLPLPLCSSPSAAPSRMYVRGQQRVHLKDTRTGRYYTPGSCRRRRRRHTKVDIDTRAKRARGTRRRGHTL